MDCGIDHIRALQEDVSRITQRHIDMGIDAHIAVGNLLVVAMRLLNAHDMHPSLFATILGSAHDVYEAVYDASVVDRAQRQSRTTA